MRAGARYGILGGTFDPPHYGHLALAQEAVARLRLDRVWFLPAADPPHKRDRALTAAPHRAAMTELAIAGDERFGLDRTDLDRPGPSYTVDTLDILRDRWGPDVWIGFITGWDMLLYLPKWHDPEGVLARLDALIVAQRPGSPGGAGAGQIGALKASLPSLRSRLTKLEAPQLDISSTVLRQRVAAGLPVRYLTPDAVCSYIIQHRLYLAGGESQPAAAKPGAREEGEQ